MPAAGTGARGGGISGRSAGANRIGKATYDDVFVSCGDCMKIEDLEAFVAVVHTQSISAAAEALALTQPSITRRVQSLEEALGQELLDRNTKPPKPNATGRQVYEQCRAVLREVELLRALATDDSRPTGGLRLALPQGLGDLVLPQALASLRAQWPELAVQVSTGWASPLMQRIDQGELDAVTVLLPAGHALPKGLLGQSLGTLRLVVVGRAGSTAGLGKARPKLADCAPLGWVLNPDGCGFRAGLQRALAAQGLAMQVRLETFGRELQLQLVADGLGLGLVPEPLLAASAWREQLEIVPLADFKPLVELWLVQGRQLGKLQTPVAEFAAVTARALGLGAAAKVVRKRA